MGNVCWIQLAGMSSPTCLPFWPIAASALCSVRSSERLQSVLPTLRIHVVVLVSNCCAIDNSPTSSVATAGAPMLHKVRHTRSLCRQHPLAIAHFFCMHSGILGGGLWNFCLGL